jgi:molecular chaperone GrpE
MLHAMNDRNESHDENEFVSNTEESALDDLELEEIEEQGVDKLKVLRDKLTICEKEKSTYLEEVQRVKADFLNSKRRLTEQLQRDTDRVEHEFLKELLPLADSFSLALNDTTKWEDSNTNWKVGVEAIHNQLMGVFKKHGLQEVGSIGEAFDPSIHEAVSTTDGDAESDVVLEVLQKGYMHNDVILRPAKVIISN